MTLTQPPAAPPDPSRLSERILPRTLTRYGVLLGLVMMAAAWVWVRLIRDQNAFGGWFPAQNWLAGLLAGALVGSCFAFGAWALLNRVPALKRIETLLLHTLHMEAFRWFHAVAFGLIAGLPEEILFRGALQPEIGLVAASVLFGALHAITPAYFIYATVAGLMLGALANWQDALWAPVAAHALIDTIMFLLLIRTYRRQRPPR